MTVSGAPETAPIAPPFCLLPPPVTCGNATARYGLARTVLGIAPASRRFCALRLPPHASNAIYINPAPSPSKGDALSLPIFPWPSASAGALPPSKDAVLPEHIPLTVWRRAFPLFPPLLRRLRIARGFSRVVGQQSFH